MDNKIIVRNKVFRKGELASKFVILTSEYGFDSLMDFRKHFGDTYIMKELFDESIEQGRLEDSMIYKKYEEILESGKDNEMFSIMYKLKNDLAVSLSEHIYLHHIAKDLLINKEKILPWECVDSKIYIADTWWETDEDILNDLKSMSFIEFMSKYKAY
jgi:hypothetical protein